MESTPMGSTTGLRGCSIGTRRSNERGGRTMLTLQSCVQANLCRESIGNIQSLKRVTSMSTVPTATALTVIKPTPMAAKRGDHVLSFNASGAVAPICTLARLSSIRCSARSMTLSQSWITWRLPLRVECSTSRRRSWLKSRRPLRSPPPFWLCLANCLKREEYGGHWLLHSLRTFT